MSRTYVFNRKFLLTVVLTSLLQIRLYYIGPDNYLKEYIIPGLIDGDLNAAKFAVKPGSKFLYAVSVLGSYAPRVGYQCANSNLCEANYDGAWHTQEI